MEEKELGLIGLLAKPAIAWVLTIAAIVLIIVSLNMSWFYMEMEVEGDAYAPPATQPVGEGSVYSTQEFYLDKSITTDERHATALGQPIYNWSETDERNYEEAEAIGQQMFLQKVLLIVSMVVLAINAVIYTIFAFGKLNKGVAIGATAATLTLLLITGIFLPATLPAALASDEEYLLPQYMDDSVGESTESFTAYDVNQSYVRHAAYRMFDIEYGESFAGEDDGEWNDNYEGVSIQTTTDLSWSPGIGWILMLIGGAACIFMLPLVFATKGKKVSASRQEYDWVEEEIAKMEKGEE